MELKLKDIFSTIMEYDEYCEFITEKIEEDAYEDLKLYGTKWWDIMGHPIKEKEDINGFYFSIDPFEVKNIYAKFTHYENDFLYYDISDIIYGFRDIHYDSFNICDWAGEDWVFDITDNDILKILYNMYIESPDKLEATEYVKLIAFLHKNYSEIINSDMTINNIIDKIYSFLQSNYINEEDRLILLSNLLKNDLFDLKTTNIVKYINRIDEIFNLLKNINKNNVKSIIEEIKNSIKDNTQIPSYTSDLFSSYFEDTGYTLYLKVPLNNSEKKSYVPLGYEKDLFENKADNQKIKNKYFKDITKQLENSPEDIYKKVIINPYEEKETIFLEDNPYLEIYT